MKMNDIGLLKGGKGGDVSTAGGRVHCPQVTTAETKVYPHLQPFSIEMEAVCRTVRQVIARQQRGFQSVALLGLYDAAGCYCGATCRDTCVDMENLHREVLTQRPQPL